jgi:hypothetical protein
MSRRLGVFVAAWLVVGLPSIRADAPRPPAARYLLGSAYSLPGHASFAVAFSPDGKQVVLGSQDRGVHVWDVQTGQESICLDGHRDWVLAVAFASDGHTVVSGCRDGSVRLWDTGGRLLRRLPMHDSAVLAVAFSPDGKMVASSGHDRVIVLADTATGGEIRRFRGHTDWTGPLAFTPDGKLLVSGSWDGTVRLWDVALGTEVRRLGEPHGRILALAISADGVSVAAGSRSRIARRWEASTGKLLGQDRNPVPLAQCLAICSDGKLVAAGARDGTLRLWNLTDGQEYRPIGDGRIPVECLAFSPDGKLLAAGSREVPAVIWNVTEAIATGRPGPRKLTTRELESLWSELADDDPPRVERCLWTMRQAPEQVVPFLQERFMVLARDSRRIVSLIAQLDDPKFAVRQKAADELADMGSLAEPNLRAALKARLPLEAVRRIEVLLEKLAKKRLTPHPDQVRGRRALQALARMDTPQTREVLQTLAAGPPVFWLTQEARAILEPR